MNDIAALAARRATVAAWLWTTVAVLVAIHLCLQTIRFETGHDHLLGLVQLFDLNEEANIPTFFSTMLLLAVAFLLAYIGRETLRRERDPDTAMRWFVLAAGFAFMGVDECAQLHDTLNEVVNAVLHKRNSGALFYGWVIPYAAIVVAAGAYFLRFFLRLPMRWRIWFALSGFIYVGGALGVEFVEGMYATDHDRRTAGYAVLTTVQEIAEMSGTTLFLHALLDYIAQQLPAVEWLLVQSTD